MSDIYQIIHFPKKTWVSKKKFFGNLRIPWYQIAEYLGSVLYSISKELGDIWADRAQDTISVQFPTSHSHQVNNLIGRLSSRGGLKIRIREAPIVATSTGSYPQDTHGFLGMRQSEI